MPHHGALSCLCLAVLALTVTGTPCNPASCPIVGGYALNRYQQPAPWWRLRWLGKPSTVQQVANACTMDDNCLAFTPDGWLYHRTPFSYLITGTFVPGNWSWHNVTECDDVYQTSIVPLCGGTYITGVEGDSAMFQLNNITTYLPEGDPGLPCPCTVNTTCGKFSCASFASSVYQSYYSKKKTPKFNGSVIAPVTKEAKCSVLC